MHVLRVPGGVTGVESLKEQAGIAACQFITDGMALGLGTGSTVRYSIIEIARMIEQEGIEVTGVPTSEDTKQLAEMLRIPLLEIRDAGRLNLTIDGADEFAPEFDLIKGGGGALTREKMVALPSDALVVVADDAEVSVLPGQTINQLELRVVGVLILIHHDVAKLVGIARAR